MESFYIRNIRELKSNQEEIERKLKIQIRITGRKVTIDGPPMKEFIASQVFEALEFGFSAKKSLQLAEPDFIFRKIHLKQLSKRPLKDIKSRVIGKEGKTKHTIEHIAGCDIIVGESEVALISSVSNIDYATTSVKNIIRGTKQANAYRYLERMNTESKKFGDDLGLKKQKEK